MLDYTKLKDDNRKTLRDIIPLEKPFTLVVEPSSLCNFRCIMCYHSTKANDYFNANKRLMPFDLYELLIKQAAEWEGDRFKVLKLSLYGEPLMNPEFCRMLALAHEKQIAERIETTSNVSLLTPEVSEGLVRGGLDYIRVSIYSPLQDKHEQITSAKIEITKIKNNLEILQEIKQKRGSQTPFVAVKMLDTYGEENELFREMYQDVADEIYIDKPHNWIATEEKSFIDALYGEGNDSVVVDLNGQNNDCKACGVSFYTFAVRNNGDASPCCVDWSGGTNIGNIRENPLKDIWQGERMKAFWKMQLAGQNHKNPSCRNCNIYKSNYYSKDNVDGVPVERLSRGQATE
ncbi:MAG: radical SAM protein [Lachnospiraceae bacterium]|nr:radical SAM protein [Lachnospiraceae bacterium]